MAGSRSLGRLTLDLVAKIGGFTQGMSQAERVAQDRTKRIERTFKGLQRSVTGIFAAIGGAALVRSIVNATAEAEESLALLNNAVEQNGGAAGRTTQQLADMASELQRTTKFSDDAVMGAEQLLLRFQSIQDLNFDRALQSAADLATVLRTDLESAAKLVGKALESPAKGVTQLEKSGVVLDKSQKELVKRLAETGRQAEAQSLLLDGLEQRYQGAAVAARQTFGGALEGLKNAAGDLLEVEGGLPAVTEQINRLTEALQNPRVQEGADRAASGFLRVLGVATEGVAELGNLGEILGRWQADAFGNLSEYDDLTGKIGDIDTAIRNVDSTVSKFFSTPVPLLGKTLEQLQQMRREVEAQRDALWGGFTTGDGGQPPPSRTTEGPSEEFLQIEARLNEQIALYGKVGEAAKIAYQIQSGELDELSAKEQQRVLELAKQFDGMVRAAEAAKEQEQAQAQLQQAYDAQQAAFIRQIYLTEEATELERLRFEINNGGLQGITEANRQYLEVLAQEVDELRARAELEAEIKAVIEETLTPLEKYQRRIEELNELLESGGLSHEIYARAVEAAQGELERSVEKSNNFMTDAAEGTQEILADSLFGAMNGKVDSIGKAFSKMLKQMLAEALAAKLAKALFGPDLAGGGWLSKFIPGFATGGEFMVGGSGGVDSQLVQFWASPGEKVTIDPPGGSVPEYATSRAFSASPAADLQPRMNISIVNQIPTAAYKVERLSASDVQIIAREEVARGAPNVVASQLENPNSRVSKAVSRNTTAARQRN